MDPYVQAHGSADNTHVHMFLDRGSTYVPREPEEELNTHTQQVVIGIPAERATAARTNPASPIFGMPILKVEDAKSVLVLKRGKGKGFSGVENDLFVGPKTSMLFGDARQSLLDLALQVKVA
jgi:NAD(P) transhydrogenase subunit beta